MTDFLSVAEDIDWLRDEWWLGEAVFLSDGHLRRGSAVLGLLLVDGLLQRAWRYYGFEGEPTVDGPDLTGLAMREGLHLEHAVGLIAGGGREGGEDVAFVGAFRIDHPETGAPADAESGFAVQQTAITRDASLPPNSAVLDPLVNRHWPLSVYLDGPAAVRRGMLISRRDIIEYFRNFLSGSYYAVHDPTKSKNPQPTGNPERNLLISELEGKVHVDRRDGIHFELLSIGQAIGRSNDLEELAARIRAQEQQTRQLAPAARLHEHPVSQSLVLFLKSPDPDGRVDPDTELLENLLDIRSPDIPIYRTFRLEHMRMMLRHRAITLVAPRLWDDPFENLVSHTQVRTGSGDLSEAVLANLRCPLYAQCWSFNLESDALWRIYSTVTKDPTTMRNCSAIHEGIRARTTATRLLQALWSASPVDPIEACFLGAVRYMPEREALHRIAKIVHSLSKKLSGGRGQAESLLIKRAPFTHEREARLVFVEQRAGFGHEDLFRIPVDPNALFRHLTLDPRLSTDDVRDREAELRRLGFTGEIVQSRLYQPVQLEVRI